VVSRPLPRARRWSWVSLCLFGLLLAQCTQNSPPPDGTIMGVASPCVGVITPAGYHGLSVTVDLTQGARAVAHQTVKGTHTYRFVVPAGHYIVATHEGDGSKPVPVTVHSGQTIHTDIPSYCM
jgi:hypothetical protein